MPIHPRFSRHSYVRMTGFEFSAFLGNFPSYAAIEGTVFINGVARQASLSTMNIISGRETIEVHQGDLQLSPTVDAFEAYVDWAKRRIPYQEFVEFFSDKEFWSTANIDNQAAFGVGGDLMTLQEVLSLGDDQPFPSIRTEGFMVDLGENHVETQLASGLKFKMQLLDFYEVWASHRTVNVTINLPKSRKEELANVLKVLNAKVIS